MVNNPNRPQTANNSSLSIANGVLADILHIFCMLENAVRWNASLTPQPIHRAAWMVAFNPGTTTIEVICSSPDDTRMLMSIVPPLLQPRTGGFETRITYVGGGANLYISITNPPTDWLVAGE